MINFTKQQEPTRINRRWREPWRSEVIESKSGRRLNPPDLRDRTRDFALRIIRLYTALPKKSEAQVIGKQVLRSGTAVGANYREGLRARSKTEYAAKLNIGLMELEETMYWLELLEGRRSFPLPGCRCLRPRPLS